jgi:hypothetical protein
MSIVEKPPTLNVDQILANANKRLRYDLQIQPDDPVLSVLALNEELFKAYMEAVKLALKEAQFEISTATRQEINEAKALSGRMIENTAGHLEKQLGKVGETWEAKFKEAAAQELAKVRQTAQFALVGGGLLLVAGGLAMGILIGNLIFTGKPH